MTFRKHAEAIADVLSARRDGNPGTIAPLLNTEMLLPTERVPADFALAYGQAISLLDFAALKADRPLIGQLVLFDRRGGQWSGP